MQTTQLLAASGVTMAAGAMVSLSFALTPPLTLLPPRPLSADANGNVVLQQQRADTFERRWQTTDIPPMPVLRSDLLEGLVGGLLTGAPQPEPPKSMALEGPPALLSDVCARHGLLQVDYVQNHRHYWRCADQR